MIPTFLWLSLQPRWIVSLQLRTKHSLLFGCCKLLKVDSTDYLLIPYTEIVTPYKFMLTWCPHWGNKLLQINFLPSLVPCFHRLLSFKIVMFINQRVIRFSGTLHSSPKKKGQCFLPQIPTVLFCFTGLKYAMTGCIATFHWKHMTFGHVTPLNKPID